MPLHYGAPVCCVAVTCCVRYWVKPERAGDVSYRPSDVEEWFAFTEKAVIVHSGNGHISMRLGGSRQRGPEEHFRS